jgi:hypothetical protein
MTDNEVKEKENIGNDQRSEMRSRYWSKHGSKYGT